jgi:hypothetical protein
MIKHFFIVGAQRCGTTYLYMLLDEHPDIEMAKPIKPEPKFFITESLFSKGPKYYESCFFGSKPEARVMGEKSTTYIESELAAQQIVNVFPDAKILVVLRNPVERAISNYWFSVNNGIETSPIEEAFYNEQNRRENYDHSKFSTSPFAYLQRGRYIEYLSMYEHYFSRDSIKVILYEKLVTETDVLESIFDFLGVDSQFCPSAFDQVINVSEKRSTEVSTEVRDYLGNYFLEPNTLLAERYGFDLKLWGL